MAESIRTGGKYIELEINFLKAKLFDVIYELSSFVTKFQRPASV